MFLLKRVTYCFFFLCVFCGNAFAQDFVAIKDTLSQHIFVYGEIEILTDTSGNLTFKDIVDPQINKKFEKSKIGTPKFDELNFAYWYRIRIKHSKNSKKNWILEFFDQTIDSLDFYYPDAQQRYYVKNLGDHLNFDKRAYSHKNLTFDLQNNTDEIKTYYFRVKSSQPTTIIAVLRDAHWFVHYALDEYLAFGLFYGMIIVFSLYNILMFFAVRQKQYLYYVIYNLSIGFYEMSADGIAFQYIWPNSPALNGYGFGVCLFLSAIFGLLFTLNFLYVKYKAPVFYKIIWGVIVLRCLFFIACLFDKTLFNYKIVDFIPLTIAFATGIYVLLRGYRPARFFVLGYSFLMIGFIIRILKYIDVEWMYNGAITHYSLSVGFIVEMIFVSFAIGDNIRHMRKKKDRIQRKVILQLHENDKLKDTLNKELNFLVDERTQELREKAAIITKQAEEISRMNALLKIDNQELQVNIEKVTRARVMSQDVNFDEFSKIYPDRETCYKYLAELKWSAGYSCTKCGHTNYLEGQLPYSRRCTKCRYEESVIIHTIFQNSRIAINKAFYMLYLVYTTKGKISSHKLSDILSIRQSTCWAYSSKMKKVMEERRKELKNMGSEGWSKLVLENPTDNNSH